MLAFSQIERFLFLMLPFFLRAYQRKCIALVNFNTCGKISICLIMSFFVIICHIFQQISILFAVWVHCSTRFLSYIYRKSNGISHQSFHWNNKIGHCPVNVMTQHNCPSTVAVSISCPKFSAFFVVLFIMRKVLFLSFITCMQLYLVLYT